MQNVPLPRSRIASPFSSEGGMGSHFFGGSPHRKEGFFRKDLEE